MSILKGKSVGSSVITASFSIGGVTKTATQTLKVEAQPLASIGKPDDVTYTGSAFTPTPAVTGTIAVSGHPVKGTDFTYSYSNNTNAGTATVYATGRGNYTGTVSSTFVIRAATISVSAPNQSFVYDGSAHGNAISVTTVNNQTATIKYGTESGSYTTTTAPTYTTAGTYTVYYQVTAPNHSTATGSYTVSITNATITVSAPNQSFVYDGSAHGDAISATTKGSQTATIKYGTASGTYNLTSAPQITNVSESKTIYWQVSAPNHSTATGSYTLTITKRAISIPTPTSNTKTYTGSAYTATFGSCSGASITNYRYSTDNSTWTTQSSNPSRTVVGTTYVQAYYTADNNHSGSAWSASATIKINNANLTVSAPNQSYTYNGSAQGTAIKVTSVNSQPITIKYGTTEGSYTLTSAPTATNVSDTKTVYYQATAPNHSTVTGSYKLTITNKSISIPAPTNKSAVYTGSAYTATFGGSTGASITNYRYSTDNKSWTESKNNPSRSTVGTTYVQAYYTANTNYTGSAWSASAIITVTNAAITVSAPNQNYTYNGSAHGNAISVTTVNNQTATIKYGTESGSYTTTTAPTYTTAGTYTVYYQVTAPNHSTATGSYSITIGRATPSFELNGQTVAYHNTAYIKARASVVGTIHWGESASSMSSKTSVSTPSSSSFNTTVTSRTSIGTTTIYAYFVPTDTTNYNSVGSSSSYSKSTSAKVNQATDADIVVTVSGNHVYTGSAQVLATKTSGEGVSHFTLGYTTSSSTGVDGVTWGTQDATTISATIPGTYYIWYKFTPDGNHSNTQTGKKLDPTCQITGNAEISVSVTNPQNYTYNGSAHGTGVSATTHGGQTATIKYGTASGSYTTTTVPTYVNAGSYTVYYQVTAQYHATKTGSYVINIGKADQPMTISPVSKTIYNTVGYNTFKIIPSENQGAVTYATGNANYATVETDGTVKYVGAGTVTITATAAGNSNYKSGSKTCTVTCVVDTKNSYAELTGGITFTQTNLLPAKGLTLTSSNVSSYAKYTSSANQKITWVSGNVTDGTITYSAFVGDNVTIPTLGSDATTTTTSRTVKYTITATGEGGKTLSRTLTSLNQEINKLESISLALNPSTIKYGGQSTPKVVATYTSTSTKDVSGDATFNSGTPSVAEVQ